MPIAARIANDAIEFVAQLCADIGRVGRKIPRQRRAGTNKDGDFWPGRQNRRDQGRRAFVHVRCPKWNGAVAILKPKPTSINAPPTSSICGYATAPAIRTWRIASMLVVRGPRLRPCRREKAQWRTSRAGSISATIHSRASRCADNPPSRTSLSKTFPGRGNTVTKSPADAIINMPVVATSSARKTRPVATLRRPEIARPTAWR